MDFEAELGYDFQSPFQIVYIYQLEHISQIFYKLPKQHHIKTKEKTEQGRLQFEGWAVLPNSKFQASLGYINKHPENNKQKNPKTNHHTVVGRPAFPLPHTHKCSVVLRGPASITPGKSKFVDPVPVPPSASGSVGL